MKDRNSQLDRSRPRERLTKDEIATLDKEAAPAAPPPPPKPPPPKASAKPPDKPPVANTQANQGSVRREQLTFHWTTRCPECGFKVSGNGQPQPGKRLARCGQCKVHIFLAGK